MTLRRNGEFLCESLDGDRFCVVSYTTIISADTLDDPNATREGLSEFVNLLPDGRFEVVGTGLVGTRADA